MTIEHFAVGPLGCNCTIVADGGEAIVVDGGDEVDEIVRRLEHLNASAKYLIHTHAHFDHIGALADLRDRTGATGMLHPADGPLYAALHEQARLFGVPLPRIVDLDADLCDGDVLRAGQTEVHVLHTPGHTPGSVSFDLRAAGTTTLLTGDTLFRGAIGRWDLGGTSAADIIASIRERLLVYPDETVVVPGHGAGTTIGTERRTNPFLLKTGF